MLRGLPGRRLPRSRRPLRQLGCPHKRLARAASAAAGRGRETGRHRGAVVPRCLAACLLRAGNPCIAGTFGVTCPGMQALAGESEELQPHANGGADEPEALLVAIGAEGSADDDEVSRLAAHTLQKAAGRRAGEGRGRGAQEELELALGDAEGELDPAVLQTLPTSMQLELLQRLREAKMARNRESFQQRAAQPASFSSFQMEEYLKASALRRAPPAALFRFLQCS